MIYDKRCQVNLTHFSTLSDRIIRQKVSPESCRQPLIYSSHTLFSAGVAKNTIKQQKRKLKRGRFPIRAKYVARRHAGKRQEGTSVYHLVGAAAAGKSFGLGLEGKAHTKDVAHRFAERLVAFELRVGIDVGMHFHVYIILVKQVA